MVKNRAIIRADYGKQDLFITREFDAPRELVFKAYTDANLYNQWLGPKDLTMTLEKFEPGNGGSYRYAHTDKSGNEFIFNGVFHEVTTPERIIQTFEYEGLAEKGRAALEIAKFDELPGNRTKVISHSIFQSVADRDGMWHADMEHGINESYDRLDELLAHH